LYGQQLQPVSELYNSLQLHLLQWPQIWQFIYCYNLCCLHNSDHSREQDFSNQHPPHI
jgi:hypothetical protein